MQKSPDLSEFPASLPAPHRLARRSFLRSLGLGAALLAPGTAVLSSAAKSMMSNSHDHEPHQQITGGDAAILQFLAAAELIETDLWQQYTELADGNSAYQNAIDQLDEDMPQYIADNTDDELSHATFLNAFLKAKGARQVNLDAFRTLPSSQATGAAQIGRLTNLSQVNVDTSWYLRYRSSLNPDFGATFPQFIDIINFPTIPGTDLAFGSDQIQAIANAAGFHFAAIEQGGTSLYATMALKASSLTVLQIIAGIGGAEVNHFAIWHDKAGNAPAVSVTGVTFPDLESFNGDETRQKNLIMPEPCTFIDPSLPECSVIRPGTTPNSGAVASLAALTNSNIFSGQSPQFFALLNALAQAADSARRIPQGHHR